VHEGQLKAYASYFLLAVLFGFALWLFFDRDALRDESSNAKKPFSLSRVQLWWWTLIVLGTAFALYGIHGRFWPFNATCLVLLGLSATTTAAGRIIDERQDREANTEHKQNSNRSEGFWRDLLSDGRGLSVHRFQAVMFNIGYGVGFLLDSFSTSSTGFPTFDSTTLALLAVSSGAYVVLKANETPPKGADSAASTSSTESGQGLAGEHPAKTPA